ncbi:Tripartite tricarboxylate transporter family receptor [Pigmentiphaga humi]|uniref:Tripartite tricarboxylate transporter family receptor n=1 Tax=Pigmentiphaga humi TaxID=2478468 RepID=A0A3P4AWN6_9BURK|nr:tripartite tricarboxylate transporter substrate binding protein [Pigmentiphaga humi]VCU68469.1 Tripartite tricarboxylate transporter family receptor [Pigmentiphaga humi]
MLKFSTRLAVGTLFAAVATASFAQAPAADDAAAKNALKNGAFRIVAPFPPGGPVDVLSRLLGTGLQHEYGQSAVVDNRPGANGNIGIDMVKRAAGDGHTMLVVPAGNMTINPTLMANLPYDVDKDFTAVAMLAKAPNVVAVFPTVPVKNIQELIALTKSKPGTMAYGSPGVGSGLHLAGELFKEATGADLLHVPYKGTTQALNDALGGQIQVIFGALPTLMPQIQSGKLRALALTGNDRSALMPEIPTLAEAGVKGVNVVSWYGVYVPKSTPANVSGQLARDVTKILNEPATLQTLKAQGLDLSPLRLEEFRKFQADETKTWEKVIKDRGITAG